MFISFNCYLVLEFSTLINPNASLGFVSNAAFWVSISALHLTISSCFSKMICMDGHTSIIEWLISNQISSLAWGKVSAI